MLQERQLEQDLAELVALLEEREWAGAVFVPHAQLSGVPLHRWHTAAYSRFHPKGPGLHGPTPARTEEIAGGDTFLWLLSNGQLYWAGEQRGKPDLRQQLGAVGRRLDYERNLFSSHVYTWDATIDRETFDARHRATLQAQARNRRIFRRVFPIVVVLSVVLFTAFTIWLWRLG